MTTKHLLKYFCVGLFLFLALGFAGEAAANHYQGHNSTYNGPYLSQGAVSSNKDCTNTSTCEMALPGSYATTFQHWVYEWITDTTPDTPYPWPYTGYQCGPDGGDACSATAVRIFTSGSVAHLEVMGMNDGNASFNRFNVECSVSGPGEGSGGGGPSAFERSQKTFATTVSPFSKLLRYISPAIAEAVETYHTETGLIIDEENLGTVRQSATIMLESEYFQAQESGEYEFICLIEHNGHLSDYRADVYLGSNPPPPGGGSIQPLFVTSRTEDGVAVPSSWELWDDPSFGGPYQGTNSSSEMHEVVVEPGYPVLSLALTDVEAPEGYRFVRMEVNDEVDCDILTAGPQTFTGDLPYSFDYEPAGASCYLSADLIFEEIPSETAQIYVKSNIATSYTLFRNDCSNLPPVLTGEIDADVINTSLLIADFDPSGNGCSPTITFTNGTTTTEQIQLTYLGEGAMTPWMNGHSATLGNITRRDGVLAHIRYADTPASSVDLKVEDSDGPIVEIPYAQAQAGYSINWNLLNIQGSCSASGWNYPGGATGTTTSTSTVDRYTTLYCPNGNNPLTDSLYVDIIDPAPGTLVLQCSKYTGNPSSFLSPLRAFAAAPVIEVDQGDVVHFDWVSQNMGTCAPPQAWMYGDIGYPNTHDRYWTNGDAYKVMNTSGLQAFSMSCLGNDGLPYTASCSVDVLPLVVGAEITVRTTAEKGTSYTITPSSGESSVNGTLSDPGDSNTHNFNPPSGGRSYTISAEEGAEFSISINGESSAIGGGGGGSGSGDGDGKDAPAGTSFTLSPGDRASIVISYPGDPEGEGQCQYVELTASATSIQPGQSATLTWESGWQGTPGTLTAEGQWSGTRSASGNESTGKLNTPGLYTYQLFGPINGGGRSACYDTVTVNVQDGSYVLLKDKNIEIRKTTGESTRSKITVSPISGFTSTVTLSADLPSELQGKADIHFVDPNTTNTDNTLSSDEYSSGAHFYIDLDERVPTKNYLITIRGTATDTGGNPVNRSVDVILSVKNLVDEDIEEF